MRVIYTDEAGVTTGEPVTIVAGLIVNPDVHWAPAITRIRQAWDEHIPTEYRRQNKHKIHKDFTFHAKDVSDGRKYPNWPEERRRALLKAMMGIPREFEIPVVCAAVKRGALDWTGWPDSQRKQMTPAKSDHMSAFLQCIGEANKFIAVHHPKERALVTCDDNGEMREILRRGLNQLQAHPMPLDVFFNEEGRERRLRTEICRADRIIDEVYFLERRNAPFLQLVDACAFGFRRCFSDQTSGDEYFRAISGGQSHAGRPPDWEMFTFTIHERRQITIPSAILAFPDSPQLP